MALILAALATGSVFIVPRLVDARVDALEARVENLKERAELAEKELRVTQERWNDLKVELAKRNIPLSDH